MLARPFLEAASDGRPGASEARELVLLPMGASDCRAPPVAGRIMPVEARLQQRREPVACAGSQRGRGRRPQAEFKNHRKSFQNLREKPLFGLPSFPIRPLVGCPPSYFFAPQFKLYVPRSAGRARERLLFRRGSIHQNLHKSSLRDAAMVLRRLQRAGFEATVELCGTAARVARREGWQLTCWSVGAGVVRGVHRTGRSESGGAVGTFSVLSA
jgi:hypothetical protein